MQNLTTLYILLTLDDTLKTFLLFAIIIIVIIKSSAAGAKAG